MTMDLLQLRYFYDSAQNENFSRTAETYMVPTSSVSAAVKRLERELGVSLFDRTSNRITLNQRGRVLAQALGRAFGEVEQALEAITREEECAEIRLLVRARSEWVSRLVIEYKQMHPRTVFHFTSDPEIRDYTPFDLIIDEQSERYGDRERFLLSVEPLCIKAAASSPLVGRSLTMRQLRDQPFVMMGRGNAMRRLLENTGKRCGFVPRVVMECNDRQSLLRCVEAGLGLNIGSRRALQEPSQQGLVALQVEDFDEIQSVYVYRRPETGNGSLRRFCAYLTEKRRL